MLEPKHVTIALRLQHRALEMNPGRIPLPFFLSREGGGGRGSVCIVRGNRYPATVRAGGGGSEREEHVILTGNSWDA